MSKLSVKARISVPSTAKRGEIITVKTLVSHPMETGYRRNSVGASIPRDIIEYFECRYNDELVIGMDLHPAIAANPYLRFHVRADKSGQLKFFWRDQKGAEMYATRELKVED